MLPFEIQIDDMSYLRGRLVELRDSLETGDFENIGSLGVFGQFDRTGMLSHHHSLAHGLMLETIKAIVESIDVFYTSLVALQEGVDDQDGHLRQQMLSYERSVQDLAASSHLPGVDDARDRYRNRHGSDT